MIVNMRTAVATVNIAFSSSRNAALIERKMLQVHNIIYETPSLYIERTKNPIFFHYQTALLVSQYIARIRNNIQTRTFFWKKSVINTLQTWVDMANEYMQAHNIGAGVKKHLSCRVHYCKCAGYTMLCLHLFSLTNFFELKISFST